ncbi:MAG: glycosyltransferase [Candidatus Rokuibacteriota bacterium]
MSSVRPETGERIRVVRIIARMNVGGPAIHVTLLTERLDPRRYESLLVTGTEDRHEGNYLTLSRKRLDRLLVVPGLGREIRGLPDAAALGRLVRVLREARPHIVHTHTAKAGMLGRLAARWCGVPRIVHTYHGHVLQGYFGRTKTRLFVGFERWLARRTDRLLAVSERVRQDLLDLGVGRRDRFDVVPLGLDLDRFMSAEAERGSLRREQGFSSRDLLVGIVARLVPVKMHEVFLRSAAEVSRRLPESRFVVVGDGERRAELETLARSLGLGGRVRFLGWRADLDRIYADLDVVVLTSRNEGSPVSLIEAMAAARPVVATRVGGVPDLVDHGVSGLLAPPGDAAAVAEAIVALLGDDDRRRRLGEAGRKRVYPAFSAQRLVADIDRLYSDLVAAR